MKDKSSYFITNNNNHIRVTKEYFHEIFLPVFNKIDRSISPIIKSYDIAGRIINLNFYSQIIFEKMHQAISHNEVKLNQTPELTVYLWDSVSTNTNILSPYIRLEYINQKENDSKNFNHECFLGIYINGEGTLNLYDEKNNKAYFWINDSNNIPFWISAAPLRTIFHWFLSKHNIHLVHGAVIGLNNKSILITAKGGSGKSTTALSCLFAGMDYLGDDYIIVESGDKIKTHRLFNSVKVFPKSLDIFPQLKNMIWNKNNENDKEGKAIIFLSDLFSSQLVKSLPLHAIFIPVIKNTNKTKIVKASKLQTMLAMIPTTLFQLSLTKSNKMVELKSIIERTPCYFLELGNNISEVPEAIKSFLLYESN